MLAHLTRGVYSAQVVELGPREANAKSEGQGVRVLTLDLEKIVRFHRYSWTLSLPKNRNISES